MAQRTCLVLSGPVFIAVAVTYHNPPCVVEIQLKPKDNKKD